MGMGWGGDMYIPRSRLESCQPFQVERHVHFRVPPPLMTVQSLQLFA